MTFPAPVGQTRDVRLRDAAITAIAISLACDSPKGDGAPACHTTLPTACPSPIHYSDVSDIIGSRCAGPCHNGIPDGPWPLTDYDHVADWADVIRDELAHCRMPPPDSEILLEPAEKDALLQWIRCGYLP